MTLLRSAALTDIGRVRRKNEDRFLRDETLMLFGVADGVGGLPGGADAAQHTVDEISNTLRDLAPETTPDLVAVTQRANRQVHLLGATLSPSMGIGSTLTFGLVRDSCFHIAH